MPCLDGNVVSFLQTALLLLSLLSCVAPRSVVSCRFFANGVVASVVCPQQKQSTFRVRRSKFELEFEFRRFDVRPIQTAQGWQSILSLQQHHQQRERFRDFEEAMMMISSNNSTRSSSSSTTTTMMNDAVSSRSVHSPLDDESNTG